MTHYIDADRLREELQKPKNELKVGNYYLDNSEQAVGYENALVDFELLIDSLQQEQSEVNIEEKEDSIIVPRWFLEVVENTLRIQYNINEPDKKKTGESCQDRNIHQSLNGIRKLLNEEELTGMERLEKLQPSIPFAQQEQPDKDKKTFNDYLKVSPSERRKMNMTEILGEEKLAETKKQMEQPEVNFEKELEEEIERFYRTDEYRIADALGRGFETLARHFAEWGAKHLKR